VNTELERMWKEVVVTCFKVLYRHLPGGTEKNDEKPLFMIAGLRRTSGYGEQINRMRLVARPSTTHGRTDVICCYRSLCSIAVNGRITLKCHLNKWDVKKMGLDTTCSE
jgi:hypothetical protein